MASGKRLRYVSDCDENTSFSESESNSNSERAERRKPETRTPRRIRRSSDDSTKITTSETRVPSSKTGRKEKCFSRNALLARENRRKKKAYVTNLESELRTTRQKNKELSTLVSSQQKLIQDLTKEVRYLKSVLANSPDICNLLRNINHTTGMSVRSSLDIDLSLNNCVSKPGFPMVARKTAHPFEELGCPAPDYDLVSAMTESPLFDDYDFDSILMNDATLSPFDRDVSGNEDLPQGNQFVNNEIPLEHNYTCLSKDSSQEDDTGVCLHVSKHRVSLEFCHTCSDQAQQNWVTY